MSLSVNIGELDKEWSELADEYRSLESANQSYLELHERLEEMQEKCTKQIQHQLYRMQQISKNLKSYLRKEVPSPEEKEKATLLEKNIMKRKAQIHEIEQGLPQQNSRYLKIILGDVNVSILNRNDKVRYKDEYEKFKLILNVIGLLLSFLNILFNLRQFMFFNVYISLVQYMQFRYQKGVLYRLKALGERHNMDITIEGFHSWMWRGLSFLIPFLFAGYIFQCYNAWTLYQLTKHPDATWQIPVLSILFLILFIGNTMTTLLVIPQKLSDDTENRYRLMNLIASKKQTNVREQAPEATSPNIGAQQAVFLRDPDLMRKTFQVEGTFPKHPLPESWTYFNKKFGYQRGLFFMDGKDWLQARQIFNKPLLKDFIWMEPPIRNVCEAKVVDIEKMSDQHTAFEGIESFLYKWSVEVVLSVMLGKSFEQCQASSEFRELVQQFSRVVYDIFKHSAELMNIPPTIADRLNVQAWQQFERVVPETIRLASEIIEFGIQHKHSNDGLLDLMTQKLEKSLMMRIFIDFIIAAGDTTLVLLSLYSSGRDERFFSDPEQFNPYRWDRSIAKTSSSTTTAAASLPFALGARSCIGQKIAQLQMHYLLSMILTKFDMSIPEKQRQQQIKPILKMITVPNMPVQVIFKSI
uniref:Uncharacterized protein n=1 Tax=Anopheles atroparvus TaxID=41427 RepID=A0A182J3M5_ANOAO